MAPSKKKADKTTRIEPASTSGVFSNIRWGESYVSLLLGAIVVVVAAALGLFYVKLHQPKAQILPPAQISRVLKLTVSPSASVSAQPLISPSITISPTSVPHTKLPLAVTPKPVSEEQTGQKTYVVQKNDDLWSIAVKEYGSGYSWVSIAESNHLANPGKIYSGDTLIIPSVTPILVQNNITQQVTPTPIKSESSPTKQKQPTITVTQTPKSNPTISITGSTYTVQKGDTLWNIAVRAYGNGYKWVNIANANNLANPSVIHAGNVLTIPRPQTL